MNRINVLALIVAVAFGIVGCQAAPTEEKAPETGVATPGKAPESMIPDSAKDKEKAAENTPTATLAKCEGCQMEVPKAELTSHDGMMLCKNCMASHKH